MEGDQDSAVGKVGIVKCAWVCVYALLNVGSRLEEGVGWY